MLGEAGLRLRQSVSDALFPKTCYACGNFIPVERRATGANPAELAGMPPKAAFYRVMHPYLCPACLTDYAPVDTPLCAKCGEPFKSRADADHLCGDCITHKKHFYRARACAVYDGALLNLIHAYKYQRRIGLAKPFGLLMYLEFIRHYSDADIDTVAAVPLHQRRLRSRGYNQTFLMIRRWPQMTRKNGISSSSRMGIDADMLVRRKNTATQTGLDRRTRIKNMKNAFVVKHPDRVAGKNVLLVDDVYTTGSTVEECARVLVRARAAGVFVLTLARAV
ncbi:MAG: ComF family protein [Desulfobacterales bacterium]|nr:ComF family protein [Desulfobacterales bacterium]MBS3755561.1 ComF family protein [Desulfobacterales bacterium]